MRRIIVLLFILSSIISGCGTEPENIEFGFDQCTFCEMTIVDQTHACILVTSKGKSLKFDAIECMIRYVKRGNVVEYKHMLVTDYLNAGKMIDVQNAAYIISAQIPSPMGANLSAIEKDRNISEFTDSMSVERLNWKQVYEKFN